MFLLPILTAYLTSTLEIMGFDFRLFFFHQLMYQLVVAPEGPS